MHALARCMSCVCVCVCACACACVCVRARACLPVCPSVSVSICARAHACLPGDTVVGPWTLTDVALGDSDTHESGDDDGAVGGDGRRPAQHGSRLLRLPDVEVDLGVSVCVRCGLGGDEVGVRGLGATAAADRAR